MKLMAILLTLAPVSCSTLAKLEEPPEFDRQVIDTSGTSIDCRGEELNQGRLTELVIRGPIRDVSIENCRIRGSIRLIGLGRNGEAEAVRRSSLIEGHTQRAQDAAPRHVRIRNVQVEAQYRIPLYLAPGVRETSVTDSTFTGRSVSTTVYLDAESGHNTLIGNTFATDAAREVIAIDGSAHNHIIANRFETVRYGGIYLYRNCGEGGTVRHQTPRENRIEANRFNLSRLGPGDWGIWLGSRDGRRLYCRDDRGHPFGSSIDDRDFADANIVHDNDFSGSDRTIRDQGMGNEVR